MSKDGMLAAVAAAVGDGAAEDTVKVTPETVKAYFPEVAASLIGEGAKAENARIMGIEAAALPGHGAIIEAHKKDPSKTPADAMLAVITAEKASRGKHLAALEADEEQVKTLKADPLAANAAAVAKDDAEADAPHGEQAWAAEFDGSKKLRAEFGSVENYVAFKKADARGAIRVMSKKAG